VTGSDALGTVGRSGPGWGLLRPDDQQSKFSDEKVDGDTRGRTLPSATIASISAGTARGWGKFAGMRCRLYSRALRDGRTVNSQPRSQLEKLRTR